jgi:hypothetical protein
VPLTPQQLNLRWTFSVPLSSRVRISTAGLPGLPGAQGEAGPTQLLTGKTLWVQTNGDDDAAVRGDEAKPYATPEAANAAAQSGDTIVVRAGTYNLTSSLGGRGFPYQFVADPGATLIPPAGTPVFTLAAGSEVKVSGGGTFGSVAVDAPFANSTTSSSATLEVVDCRVNGAARLSNWTRGTFTARGTHFHSAAGTGAFQTSDVFGASMEFDHCTIDADAAPAFVVEGNGLVFRNSVILGTPFESDGSAAVTVQGALYLDELPHPGVNLSGGLVQVTGSGRLAAVGHGEFAEEIDVVSGFTVPSDIYVGAGTLTWLPDQPGLGVEGGGWRLRVAGVVGLNPFDVNVTLTADGLSLNGMGPSGSPVFSGRGDGLTNIPQAGVTGLAATLALKAPLASPVFTGAVTVAGIIQRPDAVVQINLAAGIDFIIGSLLAKVDASNGGFHVGPFQYGFGGSLSGGPDVAWQRATAGVVKLTNSAGGGGVLEFPQVTSGGTPSSNSARVYAKDVAGTAEIFVKDEAGTETQISPHATDGPDGYEAGEVVLHDRNDYLGRERWLYMTRLALEVERLTGKKFLHERSVPRRSWEADQEAKQQQYDAERHGEQAAHLDWSDRRAAWNLLESGVPFDEPEPRVRPAADVRKPRPKYMR